MKNINFLVYTLCPTAATFSSCFSTVPQHFSRGVPTGLKHNTISISLETLIFCLNGTSTRIPILPVSSK